MIVDLNLPPETGPYSENSVYDVPMNEIFADDSFNVRGLITPLSVIELAREIKANGLLQPVTLQPYDRNPPYKFRLVAGHRRFMAHRVNNAQHIRSLIKNDLSDLEARVLNLTENTQREELNILQESKAIDHLRMGGWNQQQVADRIGKSRGWVQTRFYLLELPFEIQEMASLGFFKQHQIHELWSLKNYDEQITLAKQIKDAKLLGKKKDPKAAKVKRLDLRKIRTREEIFEMQEIIQDATTDDHPAAKALAWAAGEISDKEIHELTAAEAKKHGKVHFIPDHLKNSTAPVTIA